MHQAYYTHVEYAWCISYTHLSVPSHFAFFTVNLLCIVIIKIWRNVLNNSEQVTRETLQTENEKLRQRIAELEHSESSYRNMFEHATLGIFRTSPEGKFLDANPKTAHIVGYESREELMEQVTDIAKQLYASPEERQKVFNSLRTNKGKTQIDSLFRHRDGTIVMCQLTIWVVADQQGDIQYIEGFVEDITERKQQQEALQKSEAMARAIINASPDIMLLIDINGTILAINEITARVFRKEVAEVLGKNVFDFLPPDAAKVRKAKLDEVIATKDIVRYEEHLGERYLDNVLSPVLNDQGEVIQVSITSRNITERKAMEQQLRAFQTMVEYAPDMIQMADIQGIFTYSNAASITLFGDIAGKHIPDVVAESEDMPAILSQLSNDGLWMGELECRNVETQATFPTYTTAFAIYDSDQHIQGFCAILRDLTEQKQAEQEREALQQQIIEAQQTAIHELSTPLLPLAPNILALPLVGSIDTNRANLIMETLLEGIAIYQTDVAIIDITGVKVMDTQVAQALIRTAQAVQLLGAQVVLTGIQPQMAQTLVHLGADMSSIVTHSTLQRGIAYALNKNETNGTLQMTQL